MDEVIAVDSNPLPAAHKSSPKSALSKEMISRAIRDFRVGLESWRIWWLLGIGDIRQRYARSRLGQFWITLSMAIFVFAIGSVYSLLFHQPIRQFLPYVAANFVVWTLISGLVIDSCTTFIQADSFLRQGPLPKTVFVMRIIVRNLVVFSHNFIIVPIVFIVMGQGASGTLLLVPLGLMLVLLAGFFTGLLLGILCARFRDLPQIVQNLVQVAFFITPIVWPADSVRGRAGFIVDLNPFAAFLQLVSEPLLGNFPPLSTYLMAFGSIAILAALSIPLFVRFRARIVYWL